MTDVEDDAVENAIDRLVERFPTLARDHIETIVREELAKLDSSHVRDFIPVLVERAASDRLREEAEPVRLSSTGEGPVLIGGSAAPDPIEVQRRSEGHGEPTLGNSGGA